MDRLLQGVFGAFIRRGTFKLTTSRGRTFVFGDGTGVPVAVRLTSRRAELGLLRDPELKFGEAYMDGTLVVEQGTIADVLAVLLAQGVEAPKWGRPQWLLRYTRRRGRPLNEAASEVVKHLRQLWGFPVRLETWEDESRVGNVLECA